MATKGLIGRKLGMTQLFDEEGRLVPVTVIEAGPCLVVQRRTPERDGYAAIQLGFGEVKEKKLNRPLRGHFSKRGLAPRRLLREFRVDDVDAYEVGQELKADVFTAGEYVDVTGISRGKGFAGAIKRHGAQRGPMSHGSKYHRGPGSMGPSTFPGRVFKGKKLPGHMGGRRVTARGLRLLRVDPDRNLLIVEGSVPGARGSYVLVRSTTVARKKAAR
ncbi:MAG: 50S ribosomal protein L3 [Thermaerobacter sp.]|nr:50S ribosomal protein L3 [Bacillota bacterium]REJ38372.1 MAG: 50S ribosomal protein L3 [Bacillota bacterium]